MFNCKTKTDGNILTITVDLSKNMGPSKSGKTTLIASSRGNQEIAKSGIVMGLNIYKKR